MCSRTWVSSSSSYTHVRPVRTSIHASGRMHKLQMCERASANERQGAFMARPWATRTSAQSTFFGSVLHSLLQHFVFKRLSAKYPLKLGNLGTRGGKFGRWHHYFA